MPVMQVRSNFIKVQFKKLKETAKIPEQGSQFAAGYDIFACIDEPIQINPHETIKIGTGLAAAAPALFWLGVFARSGLATKQGLRPANCVGVIDPDYRGQIIVPLYNDSNTTRIIQPNEKIGQLILMSRYDLNIEEVDELNETTRGVGGFGSTGK